MLFRVNPWSVALVTAGVGLAVAPFLVNHPASGAVHTAELEVRVAELESQRAALQSRLDRSLHETDRASESVHAVEARLSQALATNRDSVAYARQLEAELRLRAGYGPELIRSAPPEPELESALVDASSADGAPWISGGGPAPELPNTTPATVTVTRFVETESAETRKVRARLARKSWDEVVQRAVIGECKGRAGASRFDGCASEVEQRLGPFQAKAQQCMAGNFGGTFYLEDGNRSSPPTNGVTLDRGIVVFCDPNLRDGGLSDDDG